MFEGFAMAVLASAAADKTTDARELYSRMERDKRISEALGPLATEFNDALGDRLRERADEVKSDALQGIAREWEVVGERIDGYEAAVGRDREEAVDRLVAEIGGAEVDGAEVTALPEETETELRELLAGEFAELMADFRDRVHGEEDLEHRFQADLEMNVARRLDEVIESFERMAGRRPYDLHDFPGERDAVLAALLTGDRVAFVDRKEVPAEPDPGRHVVLGPSGAGKSRVIAERVRRLPDDAVEHVLIPQDRLQDPTDAHSMADLSADGDVLLVWEDVHRLDERRENAVLEPALRELDRTLDGQGHDLYTLLEARSDRFDDLPGDVREDFGAEQTPWGEEAKSLWADYEPLWVEGLDVERVAELVDRTAEEYGVDFAAGAREALVERTADADSAPAYVKSVLAAEESPLTVDAVDRLPEKVGDVWRGHYRALQEDRPAEWRVLVAMKYLYDLDAPRYARLVEAVYRDPLDGDGLQFGPAVERLETRGWLTVDGDDLRAVGTRYEVHDTQLDAVDERAEHEARRLSDRLVEVVESAVPEGERAPVHNGSGTAFYDWERYGLAEEQDEAALDVDDRNPVSHNNYALLSHEELDDPEQAQHHYERAVEIDPEYAKAHNNYATLLGNELDDPEQAQHYYERAVEIEPEYAKAHNNYATLLKNELDDPERAQHHYERAVEIDPEYAKAHFNYANLLKNELDDPEQAQHHYERVVEIDPEYAKAHFNCALLLQEELDDPEQAQHHYERAVEIDPEYAEAHGGYAALLREDLGDPDEAVGHYRRALDLWLDEGESLQTVSLAVSELVDACERSGRPEAAVPYCERALDLCRADATDVPEGVEERIRAACERVG
ncbi:tetratricopeptide repeat protein [Halorubrum ezzemoulense]|uniref:tetratricopeptide repeat protein n=1 Tax=Halorubrum ezzemoulense TaxID=337243 RepID=UPI002330B1BE|nr:tetratricopeptide repeat protein [Halorubrum ezzemoulense]MDB2238763.1 tetratricopeptide repeat protein [Halorubrum ezzemoulense]MDB2249426.1 tetratricopeptide repeat protein [Halorubrum ezzemoulense]